MIRIFTVALFCLIVGISPLFIGSNRPLPWAYNAVGIGVCLLFTTALLAARRRTYPRLHLSEVGMPLICGAIVILFGVIQILPIGLGYVDHPLWQVASNALGENLPGRISINPHETIWSIVRLLTFGGAFCVSFILARQRENASLIYFALLAFASLIAVYGIIRFGLKLDFILWYPEPTYGKLSASFIGSNNAATFFGACAVASLTFYLAEQQEMRRQGEGQTIRSRTDLFLKQLGGRMGLALALVVLFSACVLMTTSRGGLFSTLAGLFTVWLIYSVRSSKSVRSSSKSAKAISVLVLAGLFILVLETAGGSFVSRLMVHGMSSDLRAEVYAQTFLAIRDNLWLGTGLGTFQDVFPAYRLDSPTDRLVWDKAHNDYLELLLGVGVPVGMVGILGLLALFATVFRGAFSRRRDSHFAVAAVGIAVLTGLHSLVDFSLQIQAYALYFAVFMGVGAAQSVSSRS